MRKIKEKLLSANTGQPRNPAGRKTAAMPSPALTGVIDFSAGPRYRPCSQTMLAAPI
jgi:hypothetical protein